jgi:DNA-directed RNA polymerase subunit RPC12/RpoP
MTTRCPRCSTALDEGPVVYRCARCQCAVPAADVDLEFVPRTHATTGASR